jgi:hypothetical protein
MIVWEFPCESRSLPSINTLNTQLLELGIFLLEI